MASPGHVYVLLNPSMPSLVKVGMTTKTPSERAAELSRATGVPTPFVVVYHECFMDCEAAEATVHLMLQQQGYRVSDAREFFSAEVADVIKIVAMCPGKASHGVRPDAGEESAPVEHDVSDAIGSLIKRAENRRYGDEGEFQDKRAALATFKQAAQLGSGLACYFIGDMTRLGEGTPPNDDLALEAYKKSVDLGYVRAYAAMAMIFLDGRHEENCRTAWSRYFSLAGVGGFQAYALDGFFYFACCEEFGWPVESAHPIVFDARNIIRAFMERFMSSHPNRRLSGALRLLNDTFI